MLIEDKPLAEIYQTLNELEYVVDYELAPFIFKHLSDTVFDPTSIIPDYETLHQQAISDTTSFREELKQQILNEKDFQKLCVLAREFAYSNFDNPASDDKELIAIIDPILRSDEYSPLKYELWLIWRTALQKEILGGPSNDSPMYNLFYNNMRNQVAASYINHLKENPDDKLAFSNFAHLAICENIVRNSRCMFGNNSMLDAMKLYQDCWKHRN